MSKLFVRVCIKAEVCLLSELDKVYVFEAFLSFFCRSFGILNIVLKLVPDGNQGRPDRKAPYMLNIHTGHAITIDLF